jgi:hypothetical protein
MRKNLTRSLTLALGLCLTVAATGHAQQYLPPGGYPSAPCPPPQWPYPAPHQPPPAPPPATKPPTTQPPATQPPTTQPPTTQPPTRPETPPANQPPAEQPGEQPQAPPETPPAPADTNPPAPSAPEAPPAGDVSQSAAQASATPIMGRGDANNRFNIFDNMSAIPANRVWFSYQMLNGFNPGIAPVSGNTAINTGFATRRNEMLYRMGAEVMPVNTAEFASHFSIAFQTQYIASTDTTNAADAWGNPEFLFKVPVVWHQGTVVSATLGFQPQTSISPFELREKTTRYYPGFLFYHCLGCNWFLQGGMQAGISDRDAPNTLDYALSLGWWFYRYDPCACPWYKPCITGIIPQVEVFGKDVIANGGNNPFDIPLDPLGGGGQASFREARHVYDLTSGVRILLYDRISWGTAFSFPLTGGDVRRTELISSLSINF